jgi:hypothetical protein
MTPRVRLRCALPAVLALAACAGRQAGEPLEVREAARHTYCQTPGDVVQVALLPDAQAVADWQRGRGIELVGADALARAPYALVEMGLRPTGGYGLEPAARARLRDGLVVLEVVFTAPAPGSLRTQALSSPCVLVQLPPGRYSGVEVRDPAGVLRASSSAVPPPSGSPVR